MTSGQKIDKGGAKPRAAALDVLIVGAGLGGLCALYRMRAMGLSVSALEAGDDVGGTWYWNRYPGARCDTESMAYSYSFSSELEQEWQWSEKYPTQPEVLRYINHVADRFDLRRHIRLNTRVVAASYNAHTEQWDVITEKGDRLAARFLVTAVGCLSDPKDPDIPGIRSYEGKWYHTGRWPHAGVDFTGQRVAVMGTGSSGVQSIPVIAEQAAQLTVFQRTPSYSLPARNRPLTDEERSTMKASYPEYRAAARISHFGIPGPAATELALEVDEASRLTRYEAAWEAGKINGLLGAYKDMLLSKEANDTAAEFVRAKILSTVKDPETARSLAPTTYPFGTKRPCLDTNYFETYNRANVKLVDLRRQPIERITRTGIQTSLESYDFDAIVLAIGFDAMTGSLLKMNICGRSGVTLQQKWADGPRAYLGLCAADFPNLFMITGPGSPAVLSNMVVSIEQHAEWISKCIGHMQDRGLRTIEPTVEAEDAWVERVSRMASKTLMPTVDSWYMGANVPGKPRVFMAFLGGVGNYRSRCDKVAESGYEGFALK